MRVPGSRLQDKRDAQARPQPVGHWDTLPSPVSTLVTKETSAGPEAPGAMNETYLSRKITPSMQAPKSTMQERSAALVKNEAGSTCWPPACPPHLGSRLPWTGYLGSVGMGLALGVTTAGTKRDPRRLGRGELGEKWPHRHGDARDPRATKARCGHTRSCT